MQAHELDAVILTSMHGIAYYAGFLYCSFGRPYCEHDIVVITSGGEENITKFLYGPEHNIVGAYENQRHHPTCSGDLTTIVHLHS